MRRSVDRDRKRERERLTKKLKKFRRNQGLKEENVRGGVLRNLVSKGGALRPGSTLLA